MRCNVGSKQENDMNFWGVNEKGIFAVNNEVYADLGKLDLNERSVALTSNDNFRRHPADT